MGSKYHNQLLNLYPSYRAWRTVLLFFIKIILISPFTYVQSQSTQIWRPEDKLSELFSSLNDKGARIAFDADINCRPVRLSPVAVYYENNEELLQKIGCYCRLDVQTLHDSTFLVRSTSSKDNFYAISLKDAQSGQSIPFALIKTFPDQRTYISDWEGEVFIRLRSHENIEKIEIQSLTYGKQQIFWQDISHSVIWIKPKPIRLNTIVHKNTFPDPVFHFRGQTIIKNNPIDGKIPFNQFTNTPGALAMLLPGYQMTHDRTISKPLRSSEQAQTMLSIDGMPVYKTDHFFGIFSAVNPDFTEKITVHRNIIPVTSGSRSSLMMEYNSSSIAEKTQIQLHANLLYSGASAKIRLSEKAGILVAGRYTYVNLLQSSYFDAQERVDLLQQTTLSRINNTISSRPLFNFYDINSKAYYKHKNHTWSLSSFHSSDIFEDNQNLEVRTRTGTRTLNIFQRDENWKNQTYMLKHAYKSNQIIWETSVYQTQFSTFQNLQYRTRDTETNFPSGVFQNLMNRNRIYDTGFKSIIEKGVLKKSKMLVGVESVRHNNSLEIAGQNNTYFESVAIPWEHNIFGQLEYISEHFWLLRPALRATYVPSASKVFFQPQFYVQKYISQPWKIKSSYARSHALMRQFMYETPTGLVREFFAFANGTSIPFGKSDNIMAGIQYTGKDNTWVVDMECFYRHMDGALNYATRQLGVIRNDQNLGLNDFSLFVGQSRYYGSEISVSYSRKNMRWVHQYTISQSEQRFNDIFRNAWHAAPQDSRHQYRSMLSLNIRNWVFSMAYSGATGLPYQDIVKARAVGDRRLLTPENVISRLPHFHRWDAGLQYNLKMHSKIITVGAHVYNIFDRENVTQRQFLSQLNTSGTQILEIESDVLQLGRVFNIGLSIHL